MFKRVEKRLKRKQREDELGLNEDMKEVLGLNDTDSDESDSDFDSDSRGDIPDADSDNDQVQGDLDEEEESDNEANQQSEERAIITIAEALVNPTFLVSLDPTIYECIVCPGKQLKNQNMVEIHTSSKAHERRFKQFKDLTSKADIKMIAQDFVEQHMSSKQAQLSADPGTSKRAEKKRLSQEKRKAKREKFKARQKAKKEVLARDSNTSLLKESEPSNKAETPAGNEVLKQEDKNDGGKPKKRKKKGDAMSDVLKASQHYSSDPPTSPPKKKHKTSRSSTDVTLTITTAADSIISSKKPKPKSSVRKAEKKLPEDNGDKRQKKRKNKNDNTLDITIPLEHAISDPPPSPPKKKRKPASDATKAPATKQKSKSTTATTAPGPTDESPKVISELQAQVKDIIKSASDLAKAARARALNGGDSDDETKPSAAKITKKRAVKTEKVQQ